MAMVHGTGQSKNESTPPRDPRLARSRSDNGDRGGSANVCICSLSTSLLPSGRHTRPRAGHVHGTAAKPEPPKRQSLAELLEVLRSTQTPARRIFARKRSESKLLSRTDNSNVLAASLDLDDCPPDPEQIGELLDLVDAAALPVKTGALTLLRRLCSVYDNAAMLVECCVLDEMLLTVTMLASGDEAEAFVASKAVGVLNQLIESISEAEKPVIAAENPGDRVSPGGTTRRRTGTGHIFVANELFAKLRQTGVAVVLDTLRAVLDSGAATLVVGLLAACTNIVKLRNKALSDLILHGLVKLKGFAKLLQPARAAVAEIQIQHEAHSVVEALAVSGFSRHFLVDSFIATVVQTLTTGMCNQRQNALRILRALSRSTNNAGALLARQQFGTGLLEAVTHENCQELRSGATHVLAGLIMPDRLESGSTARVVSLLQRAGPTKVAAALLTAVRLALEASCDATDAALALLQLVVHLCSLDFSEALVSGEQLAHRKTPMGTVLAQHFKQDGMVALLGAGLKLAGTSATSRPPQLLTAISDTLQCIAERVAKRRRRSSASDRPTVSIALVEALGQSLHPDNADDCVAAIAALRDLVERYPRETQAIYGKVHGQLRTMTVNDNRAYIWPAVDLLKLMVSSHGDVGPTIINTYGGAIFVEMLSSASAASTNADEVVLNGTDGVLLAVLDVVRMCANSSDAAAELMFVAGVGKRAAIVARLTSHLPPQMSGQVAGMAAAIVNRLQQSKACKRDVEQADAIYCAKKTELLADHRQGRRANSMGMSGLSSLSSLSSLSNPTSMNGVVTAAAAPELPRSTTTDSMRPPDRARGGSSPRPRASSAASTTGGWQAAPVPLPAMAVTPSQRPVTRSPARRRPSGKLPPVCADVPSKAQKMRKELAKLEQQMRMSLAKLEQQEAMLSSRPRSTSSSNLARPTRGLSATGAGADPDMSRSQSSSSLSKDMHLASNTS